MNSNPKIVVLHMKELIYTGIFLSFAILLIVILIFMFKNNNKKEEVSTGLYKPGVYTKAISINHSPVELQITLDKDNINAVEFKNIDESINVMYPLVISYMEDISKQITDSQSVDNISYTGSCKYTYSTILSNVKSVLNKASANN